MALHLNPNDADCHTRQGLVAIALNDDDRAMEEFNEGLRLNPDLAFAYSLRGRLKLKNHDVEGALDDEAKAVRLMPENFYFLEGHALAALYKGDDDQVAQDCAAALQISPQAYEALYLSSIIQRHAGDFKGAMNTIEQAMAIKLEDGTYFERGMLKFDLGDIAGAREDFVRVRTSSHRPYVELWIWMADTRQNNRAEADRELDVYLSGARRVKDGLWTEKMGDVLLGRAHAEAVATSPDAEATSVARNNDQCDLWFYAAQFARANKDTAGARRDLEKAVATKALGELEYHEAVTELKAMPKN